MKKLLIVPFMMCALLFTACTEGVPPANLTPSDDPVITERSFELPEGSSLYAGKIAAVYDGEILVCKSPEEKSAFNQTSLVSDYSLNFVSTQIPAIYKGRDFKNLTAINAAELTSGMEVLICFNGSFLDTYPSQMRNIDFIYIMDEPVNDFINLYLDAFAELMERDSALNDNITALALNFKEEMNMTDYEKNALAYLLEIQLGKQTFFADVEDLIQTGILDEDYLYYEEGLVLNLSSTPLNNNEFTFSISKWRSPLGAYGFADCKANRNGSSFQFEIGGEFIS